MDTMAFPWDRHSIGESKANSTIYAGCRIVLDYVIPGNVMLTKETAEREFAQMKDWARNLALEGNFNDSLKYIETAARLAFSLNFCLADDELEQLLVDIADATGPKVLVSGSEGIVFYDYFGRDNRCLTQQYLRALEATGQRYLYILESDAAIGTAKEILAELALSPRAELFAAPGNLGDLGRIRTIRDKIQAFNPSIAFMQMAPWDTVGICVWTGFPNVSRYLVNITDHAFWLGKRCSDLVLEFRSYGRDISIHERGIPPEKTIIIPYYPILESGPFKGFPAGTEGKTKILVGGSFYKMYGENDIFLTLLKKIVTELPEVVVFLAGGEVTAPMERFIQGNELTRKIFILGNRTDINAVFQNIDLSLGTYPFSGGLISQLAIANGVVPIQFTAPELPVNFIEGLLMLKEDVQLTYTSMDSFWNELVRLVGDKEYRAAKVSSIKDSIITPRAFQGLILGLVQGRRAGVEAPAYGRYDRDRFMGIYLEAENRYLHQYEIIKLLTLRGLFFQHRPWAAMRALAKAVFHNPHLVYRKLLQVLSLG